MKEHELKTWPEYFQAIIDGRKTFEARTNDRGFQEGDILILKEWEPESQWYTGRTITKRVGYLIEGDWGIPDGVCVMSLLDSGR